MRSRSIPWRIWCRPFNPNPPSEISGNSGFGTQQLGIPEYTIGHNSDGILFKSIYDITWRPNTVYFGFLKESIKDSLGRRVYQKRLLFNDPSVIRLAKSFAFSYRWNGQKNLLFFDEGYVYAGKDYCLQYEEGKLDWTFFQQLCSDLLAQIKRTIGNLNYDFLAIDSSILSDHILKHAPKSKSGERALYILFGDSTDIYLNFVLKNGKWSKIECQQE